MQKIIPIYYAEYGKYITRFRAIPYYVDCLKPVERRILLTLYEVARNQFVKSAKIVGACIGKYHPHGDQSVYSTLVNLVQQGFAIGKGNWGSPGLTDAEAAAYRYTEAKLNPLIQKLAFEYIDYVPWEEIEFESEPLYLPCPVPLGLVGHGVITGISFHRTLIPKYKLADLIKRLEFLLEYQFEVNYEKTLGPKIVPNIRNCDILEEQGNDLYQILTNGVGNLSIAPFGKIEKNIIKILGRAPNASFNSLIEDKDQLEIYLNDLSNKEIEIEVIPRKRSIDLQKLGETIWNKYLIKKLSFNCLVCDKDGKIILKSIDELLRDNYYSWKAAVLSKNVADYDKQIEKKIEAFVVQIIRYIFEEYKCTKVEEIVNYFKKLTTGKIVSVEFERFNKDLAAWQNETYNIKQEDIIEVCNKKNIRSLIENQIDTNKIELEIQNARKLIDNIDTICYKKVKELENVKEI